MNRLSKLTTSLALAAATTFSAGALASGGHHGDRLEHLGRRLDLNQAQQEQLEAIRDSHRPQLQALHREMRQRRQELRQQLRGGYDEAAVQAQAAAVGDLVERMIVLRSQMAAQSRELLSAEQRAEWDQLTERHGGRGDDDRRHHRDDR